MKYLEILKTLDRGGYTIKHFEKLVIERARLELLLDAVRNDLDDVTDAILGIEASAEDLADAEKAATCKEEAPAKEEAPDEDIEAERKRLAAARRRASRAKKKAEKEAAEAVAKENTEAAKVEDDDFGGGVPVKMPPPPVQDQPKDDAVIDMPAAPKDDLNGKGRDELMGICRDLLRAGVEACGNPMKSREFLAGYGGKYSMDLKDSKLLEAIRELRALQADSFGAWK